MKKIICLFLLLTIIFGLSGCSSTSKIEDFNLDGNKVSFKFNCSKQKLKEDEDLYINVENKNSDSNDDNFGIVYRGTFEDINKLVILEDLAPGTYEIIVELKSKNSRPTSLKDYYNIEILAYKEFTVEEES